jgi:hypothetical protein
MDLVKTGVTEEYVASIISMKRIAITNIVVTANVVASPLIHFSMMIEMISSPKHQFLQDPHVISQRRHSS